MATLLLLLIFALIVGNCAAPLNFTSFEALILPQWLDNFHCSSAATCFNSFAGNNEASVYGVSDAIFALYTVNQLDYRGIDASAWAAAVNQFQNKSGFVELQALELLNGNQPWHASAYALAALQLIDQKAEYPAQFAIDVADNSQKWVPTFLPLLSPSAKVRRPARAHSRSQIIWRQVQSSSQEISAYTASLLLQPDAVRNSTHVRLMFKW